MLQFVFLRLTVWSFTHWFFDDNVIIWNFRGVDRLNERPTHLVCLSLNNTQWSHVSVTDSNTTRKHIISHTTLNNDNKGVHSCFGSPEGWWRCDEVQANAVLVVALTKNLHRLLRPRTLSVDTLDIYTCPYDQPRTWWHPHSYRDTSRRNGHSRCRT